MVKSKNEVVSDLAQYLTGMADAFSSMNKPSDRLQDAAKWLEKLSQKMCGQGFIGCRGGTNCDSDHK